MTATILIRPAETSDLQAIVALINRAFTVEKFFVDGERTSNEDVAGKLRSGVFLTACDQSGLVGCVYVERRPGNRGYIGLLAVEPTRQRSGLGRTLMRAAEQWCTSAGCSAAEISVVNLRTELFPIYASLGYQKEREAPFTGLSRMPCHFVIMTKSLV